MKLQNNNIILFLTPALIWGSTWYAIKFQLGVVDPMLSVSYRFIAAGILLLLVCMILKLPLRFKLVDHLLFATLGASLFGINYWLVYWAESYITSGLIAVIFSLIVLFNAFFSALILKRKLTINSLLGGTLAVGGTFMIFKNEFAALDKNQGIVLAIGLSLISLLFASFGNVISGYNQKRNLPVVQANAFGMLYGAGVVFIIAMARGTELSFDFRSSYLISLGYLTIFGSIIAFTSYLKLLGIIGPERSAYVVVIIPLIAMIFSTIFESYTWQKSAIVGMPVLLLGNMIAMGQIKTQKILRKWKS